MFPETFIARAFFRRFLSTFYHEEILTKTRACEQQQNFCEHEHASTHLIFASNSSKGQILRALLNSMRPFDTPKYDDNLNGLKDYNAALEFLEA